MFPALLIYVAVGLAFGVFFVLHGVNRVDPAAAASPLVFRLVILPGCVGLWPIMLFIWVRSSGGQA